MDGVFEKVGTVTAADVVKWTDMIIRMGEIHDLEISERGDQDHRPDEI